MEPTIERWKGGLDAMLVFVCLSLSLCSHYTGANNWPQIGLFSAIVTAFFVDSFSKLQPDDGAATNSLCYVKWESIIPRTRTHSTRTHE
jgi:hypothetical protein